MSIKVREISPEEKERWDKFINNNIYGNIFQSYAWGEFNRKIGWNPIRIIVEEDGVIKAAIQILKIRFFYLPYIFFYAPGGPVGEFSNETLLKLLTSYIKKIHSKNRAIFLQIEPPLLKEEPYQNILEDIGYIRSDRFGLYRITLPKYVFKLKLDRPEETLLQSFHHKMRYNISLAKRKGVTIDECKSENELIIFYKLYKETGKRKKFFTRSFKYIKSMYETLSSFNMTKIFFAYYANEVIATVLITMFGSTCYYMYGGSKEKYKNIMAPHLLHWHVIKYAKNNGYLWYDLRGITAPNPHKEAAGFGVYRFKKSFNPELFIYMPEQYLIFKPFLYKLWCKTEIKLQSIVRFLLNWRKKLTYG